MEAAATGTRRSVSFSGPRKAGQHTPRAGCLPAPRLVQVGPDGVQRLGYHDIPANTAPVAQEVARLRAAQGLVLCFLMGDYPRKLVRRYLRHSIGVAKPVIFHAHYAMNVSTPDARARLLAQVGRVMAGF